MCSFNKTVLNCKASHCLPLFERKRHTYIYYIYSPDNKLFCTGHINMKNQYNNCNARWEHMTLWLGSSKYKHSIHFNVKILGAVISFVLIK